ncbi:probable exported protein [Aquitalea magnusonii]|uniref:Probable exported protein n=1 Tax=Aquitalea magnusonii TaxID=332411 RepID=A0A3G9GRL7_9NEIS|nr:lysozyme inhibitor LprI family protein [Aquitalea magnusonii]BBF87872.1 probable exported protein [Aquitalea magnusonii]
MPALRRLLLWLLLLLPMLATAASFDCSKAATATEQAICRQPELSVLDEQVAAAYRQHNQQGLLQDNQRQWLAGPRAECKADATCLQSVYKERLEQLQHAQLVRQQIDNAMPAYRFDITLLDWGEHGWAAEGPAIINIIDKRSQRRIQQLRLDNVFMPRDAGKPLLNSPQGYGLQWDDFDFDGHIDFAVQKDNTGPYGGPTYRVYLYDTARKQFVLNDELSTLTEENLGLFQVDAKRKRLRTFAKSGCCYHETTDYQFDARHHLQAVERLIEDAQDPAGKEVRVTRETLVNGRWKTSTRRYALDAYYHQ